MTKAKVVCSDCGSVSDPGWKGDGTLYCLNCGSHTVVFEGTMAGDMVQLQLALKQLGRELVRPFVRLVKHWRG